MVTMAGMLMPIWVPIVIAVALWLLWFSIRLQLQRYIYRTYKMAQHNRRVRQHRKMVTH